MDSPLTHLDKQGDTFQEDGLHDEPNLSSEAQRANTSSTAPDYTRFSADRHTLGPLALVSVYEVVNGDVGGELLGRDGGKSEGNL